MTDLAVLDASAVLALLRDERGADQVAELLPTAAISAVNLAEVLIVLERFGVAAAEARRAVNALAVDVLPADAAAAHAAAGITAANPRRSLSLGDCFCLAAAERTGRSAVTADRTWATLKGVGTVVVVR